MGKNIILIVNGLENKVELDDNELLVDVLREKLRLTGTKKGCGTGECGACTILLDGQPVNSCMLFAVSVEGKRIITIEGLGSIDDLHPLQKSFIKNGAVQCGFCGPGMLLTAKALLDKTPNPTEKEIRTGIAGNICRCSGYSKIIKAIQEAAGDISRREQHVL